MTREQFDKEKNGETLLMEVRGKLIPITYELDAPVGQNLKGEPVYLQDIMEE